MVGNCRAPGGARATSETTQIASADVFDLKVALGDAITHVVVRQGIRHEIGALLQMYLPDSPNLQAVVITDEHVGPLYSQSIRESLGKTGASVCEHLLVPGEASKSLEIVGELYDFLASHRVGRGAVIIALGGGVVSDVAGFVAATWMRGVRFAICPTTLEADVDACLGGKTAINMPGGKNLIGAFHQPLLVAVDPQCLETLDPRDIRAGLAESVKHALLRSEEFLAWHERNIPDLVALKAPLLRELILTNLRIKADIVHQDAGERTGVRIVLNFGHTIGHAIEECSRFRLRHGECVALGMIAACRLSRSLGLVEDRVVTRVERLLTGFGLATRLPFPLEPERIMATIRMDKKALAQSTRFVLLQGVGRPVVRADVPEHQVREAFESLLP